MSDERFEKHLEQSMARGGLRVCIDEMHHLLEIDPGLIDGDHQTDPDTNFRLLHFQKTFIEATEHWKKVQQDINLDPLDDPPENTKPQN